MNWEKRFEARRLNAGKIKVAGESWVIVRIRLPAIGGVILLPIEMKMHSEYGDTITACDGVESSKTFISGTFYGSDHFENSVFVSKRYMTSVG